MFRGQQWSYASYRVLEDTPAGQLIEVYRQDDDYYFWTRYRATRDTVVPVYSRVIGPALGIIAMPFGLIFAYFAVRLLQRASARAWQRWGRAQEKEAPP